MAHIHPCRVCKAPVLRGDVGGAAAEAKWDEIEAALRVVKELRARPHEPNSDVQVLVAEVQRRGAVISDLSRSVKEALLWMESATRADGQIDEAEAVLSAALTRAREAGVIGE